MIFSYIYNAQRISFIDNNFENIFKIFILILESLNLLLFAW